MSRNLMPVFCYTSKDLGLPYWYYECVVIYQKCIPRSQQERARTLLQTIDGLVGTDDLMRQTSSFILDMAEDLASGLEVLQLTFTEISRSRQPGNL